MEQGKYIVIEGCDGVGKTTALKALSTQLQKSGYPFILTKEPGGPKALRQEWSSLLHPYGPEYEGFRELCVNNPQIPQLAKRALYKADSFYNWLFVIKPALLKGVTVISDRSWVSDIAYGVALAGASADALFQFNTALIPEQHHITQVIYMDCPEDIREARLANNVVDHMDTLGVVARNRICDEYRTTLNTRVQLFTVVNTDDTMDNIVKHMESFVINGARSRFTLK